MEVREGYKNSEVGIIPQEWEEIVIIEICDIKRGASPRPIEKFITSRTDGINWIRIGDVDKSGVIKETQQKIIQDGKDKSVFVKAGDLLLSNSMSYGKPYILEIDGCIHDGWLAISEKKEAINKKYLFYYLMSDGAKKFFKNMSAGSGVQNLKKDTVAKLIVAVPSNTEQQAIATALSDMDGLISSLTKLIDKKKNIKQGAMQELLKPKDGWEVKKLGVVLKVGHGRSQHEVVDLNGDYPILGSGGIIGRANKYIYDKPSVLIGRKGTIDVPQYMNTPFWTIDTLFYTEIFEPNNPKYIFYQFNLIDWYFYNEASGVPSLNSHTIENIEISIPGANEQARIANILSDMDIEIETLQNKLKKYKAIKQGMMQELLTGRIRLIEKAMQ